MLISRPIVIDGVTWGTAYTLERVGDVFPVHVHNDSDIHITIVAHGSIKCTGREAIEGKVFSAKPGGTILNWNAGEAHGFIAQEDGTTLINLLKRRAA